jgi:hypothetical protein
MMMSFPLGFNTRKNLLHIGVHVRPVIVSFRRGDEIKHLIGEGQVRHGAARLAALIQDCARETQVSLPLMMACPATKHE